MKAEGVLTIPAVKVASDEDGAEVNRAFLLGCEADPAALTKGMCDGYNDMLGAISGGTSNLVRKVAGEYHGRAFLGWSGDGYVLTVVPTRLGKGVGLDMPNFLHYSGSVIVIDPKVENYVVTHRYRAERLKQRIVCIDPFRVVTDKVAVTDGINPLDGLVDYTRPSTRQSRLGKLRKMSGRRDIGRMGMPVMLPRTRMLTSMTIQKQMKPIYDE